LLSAPKVIEEVNSRFIPALVNVTTEGYPSDVPALKRVGAHLSQERNPMALAAVNVFSPGGSYLLGSTGNTVRGPTTEFNCLTDRRPELLLAFLDKCLGRQQAVTSIQQDADKDPPTKAKALVEFEQKSLRPIQHLRPILQLSQVPPPNMTKAPYRQVAKAAAPKRAEAKGAEDADAEAEKAAAGRLAGARLLAQNDTAKGIRRLVELIDKYPQSKAAEQARQLLEQWKN
jgi:hypothetical protein